MEILEKMPRLIPENWEPERGDQIIGTVREKIRNRVLYVEDWKGELYRIVIPEHLRWQLKDITTGAIVAIRCTAVKVERDYRIIKVY